MCLPRAKGCCCRDRECLCQLEQGDALATVFGAPRHARRGEGLKRGLHRCHRGFLCLSPALRCSDMTDVLVVPNTSALSSLSRLFGWDLHSCKCHAVSWPPTTHIRSSVCEDRGSGTLGAIRSCLPREICKVFLCHRQFVLTQPSSRKTSVHTEVLFWQSTPKLLSLFFFFFFLSINWLSWNKQRAPCLRVEAGPCTLPLRVTRSLKMFTIEELPFVAFSLFSAWACNCCIVVCVCAMMCFEHDVSGLGVEATRPQSAIFDDADMQMMTTSFLLASSVSSFGLPPASWIRSVLFFFFSI